jgi:hypothetical protein
VFDRLPELYAGTSKEAGAFPVQYLGANVPQAWVAGSVFHLIRALLGLDADGHNNILYIILSFLVGQTISRYITCKWGVGRLTIRFWREQAFDVLSSTNETRLIHAAETSVPDSVLYDPTSQQILQEAIKAKQNGAKIDVRTFNDAACTQTYFDNAVFKMSSPTLGH